MMASAVRLSGFTSRELGPGVPTRLEIDADGRVTSVGISAALFALSGFRHRIHGKKLRLPGIQMAIAAQHAYRLAATGTVKRFEDAYKNVLALHA
jgi:hypothetical protein